MTPRTRRPTHSLPFIAGTLLAALAVLTSGTAAAQATMPANGASATPAQKKPAKAGAQSGAASGPSAGTGSAVGGTDSGAVPAEKKPAKAGAQSGAASQSK